MESKKTGIYIFEREKGGTTKSLLKVITDDEEQVKDYCKFFAGYQVINSAARIRIIRNKQEMNISEFLHY